MTSDRVLIISNVDTQTVATRETVRPEKRGGDLPILRIDRRGMVDGTGRTVPATKPCSSSTNRKDRA